MSTSEEMTVSSLSSAFNPASYKRDPADYVNSISIEF